MSQTGYTMTSNGEDSSNVRFYRLLTAGQASNLVKPTCQHCYCGNSWVVRSSTTAGDPGGTTAWGICCKCGAATEPAYRDGP
jgi:hypothetical protein